MMIGLIKPRHRMAWFRIAGAPAGTRTRASTSGGWRDVHFTTGANLHVELKNYTPVRNMPQGKLSRLFGFWREREAM